jgi:hypothetical protein
VEWTNDTTRATALATQDGVLIKSGDTSRRYLGTFRTTVTTGQCEDSTTRRYVWNYYNRVVKLITIQNATGHTYDSTTVRAYNNDALFTSGIAYVVGVIEQVIFANLNASLTRIAGDSQQFIGIGTASTAHVALASLSVVAGTFRMNFVSHFAYPSLGYNELWITESGGNTGTDPTYNNATLLAEIYF